MFGQPFSYCPLLLAISVSYFSTSVQADTSVEPDLERLQFDPIVVTATRQGQSTTQVPARLEVINARQLSASALTDLPHVLQQHSALNVVQSGGFGQQTSIFTRGTNSNHTLVLRDNMRLNTASTGAANLQFLDASDLAQVEVLKGPASVLYGSDAIGGVVQLTSQTPKQTGAFITTQVGERNSYKTILGGDLLHQQLYGQIRAQRLSSNGSNVTDRVGHSIEPAGYSQGGVSGKLGIKQSNYGIVADYWLNQGDSEYDAYRQGALKQQQFWQQGANIATYIQLDPSWRLDSRVAQFKDDLDQRNSSDFVHNTTEQLESYISWQPLVQHKLLFGATYQHLRGDLSSYGTHYDKTINSTGYFIQHQFENQRFNTQLGVRLEDNQQFGAHTVGQAAVRYHISPYTSLYTNIGSAFKAPTFNDLYGFGGNADLQPETAFAYEIGFDRQMGSNGRIGVSGFRNQLDNLISSTCVATCDGDWVKTFPVYQNRNIKKSHIQGAEIYAKWQAQPWLTQLSYQYVKAVDESTGYDLPRRPRHNVSASIGLDTGQYGTTLSIAAKSKSQVDVSNQSTPGYASLDVNSYWQLNPHARLFASIENIANTRYKTASYDRGLYYVNGGRLASLGLTLRY